MKTKNNAPDSGAANASSTAPVGSAYGPEVPDDLRTKIKDLIRDAWQHGFDAESPDDIAFIDVFALADEALDKHWPNVKVCQEAGQKGTDE